MAVTDLEAEDFLELVYGKRKAWVDLPAKVSGYWVPFHYKWEGEATNTVTKRIDSCLRDGESLYFSVGMFRKRGRNEEDLLPTHWLWADLDEIHPTEAAKIGLTPTIAWESSRGRYQGLWRLDRRVRPEVLDKLNQALSYHLGADRSGWDRTQVLRIPGTRNFKYPEAPLIQVLWHHSDLRHDPRRVWTKVRGSLPNRGVHDAGRDGARIPRRAMPARARTLLRVPADAIVEGERSHRLWEIECLLAESGWGEDDIYGVVSDSAWNKWADVRTGETRLRREIRKASRHVALQRNGRSDHGRRLADAPGGEQDTDGESGEEPGEIPEDSGVVASPFVRYGTFMAMAMDAPKWMIQDIWTQSSHGILGGEPKTAKTTTALAMGMSIASGRDFLGIYPVHVSGPVLMIQEENAPWVIQDRMRKIARRYGLIRTQDYTIEEAERGSVAGKSVTLEFPSEIPFRILNNYGFNLALEEHREMLEAEVQAVRPAMVILDPLYLIMGGVNTDRAEYIYPFLRWLMDLRYEYDTAIVLLHHMSKKTEISKLARPGQRLMGSATFHGWVDCALYTELLEQGKDFVRVKIDKEFRSQAPQDPLELELRMGAPGDLQFDATVRGWDLSGQLEALVANDSGITARAAADQLGHDKRTILKIARGSETIKLQAGKRGRGHSHRLFARVT